ncbi:twin-arginine translocation signal domain-containing protein, partial [Haloarcula sp. JP-Z28]
MSRNDLTDDEGDSAGISRRDFVRGLGAASLLGATGLSFADDGMDGLEAVDDPIGSYPYRDWEDLYRDEWDWDSVARSTHSVNCTGSCSWNVYVKDGQVWRE